MDTEKMIQVSPTFRIGTPVAVKQRNGAVIWHTPCQEWFNGKWESFIWLRAKKEAA
jgi:hypothetical protein